jgi:hypothetical protein
MDKELPRFQKETLVLGAAMVTLLCLPGPTFAQSSTTQVTTQDRQAVQPSTPQDRQAGPSDDITRRDLARFDQFLDSHREVADQLRRTPSLIDDPQYLQSHPELNTYLQDHPSVKQEISQQPNTFMRLEDSYDRDRNMRDRDAGGRYAGGQDRDANGQDRNAMGQDRDANGQDRNATGQDRDANGQDRNAAGQDRDANGQDRDATGQDRAANGQDRDAAGRDRDANGQDRRDVASFNRFLDEHREVAEQVRKDPSLLDNRTFVQNHPALQTYLQQNPGVREQLSQNPNGFIRQEDAYNRDPNMRDRDTGGQAGGQDRNNDHRDVASFNRFLDEHREVAEQVRKDPSLLDNRTFVQNHPALQTYLQQNPGVREQLSQNPNGFMRQEDAYNRDSNMRDRDPSHDHMADFGGFLHNHSDIRNDLSRNPSVVKNQEYVQNHAELDAYLNTHSDVRTDLMANPQSFVQGARQYESASPSGTSSGAGVSGRGTTGTGTTGTTTGTSTNPTTTPHEPSKPNQ